MELNKFNYYNSEANYKYFSCSMFKRFAECEALALAELRGEWTREPSTAMQIGSYVDAWADGSLDAYKEANTSMYLKSGELKSEFRQAEAITQRIQRDEMFMRYLNGEKQVIRTGAINGVPFKTRMDVLHKTAIVDLKVMRDFESQYKPEHGRLNFIEYWGYDLQGAIYQEIERQNNGGRKLPFYIAAVTKEAEPDIGIFEIPQYQLDTALQLVAADSPHYWQLVNGLFEPVRCEKCNYCKHTKKLTAITPMEDLI